ncbi:MAG TPA: caspase family protein [Anaerolineales bacterium]
MNRKLGLVIGNSAYRDSTLARLATPDVDVGDLADVLLDPDIGAFDDVKVLVNASSNIVRRAISNFFAAKDREDLLLFYFSGHGVLDTHGRLFLAVKDTERPLLRATAIPAAFITDEMNNSRSQRQLLILDCCHSGAFARGTKGSLGASVGTSAAFEGTGYGRVVMTATDATQYAWEGDQAVGEPVNSVFTHHLIDGLKSGEADANHDGVVTIDELYDYSYRQVVKETPEQTPGKWTYKEQGEIVIAQNPRWRPSPVIEEPLSDVDEDADRRLASLYTKGLSAYWLQEWDKAQSAFSAIVELRPDYKDAAAKLAEARQQEKLARLYEQGKRASEQRDWQTAIEAFKNLRSEAPDYKDAAKLLAAAEREKRLVDRYAEAKHLYKAKQYAAVIKVFENLAAEQSGFEDPEGLLAKAQLEQQAIEKQRAVEEAYSRAVLALDAGRLQEAQRLLMRVQEMEPGYEQAERLLRRIDAEMAPAEVTSPEPTAPVGRLAAASGGISAITRLLSFETIRGWVGRVRAGRPARRLGVENRAGAGAQAPALTKAPVSALTDPSFRKIQLISAGFFATFLVYLWAPPESWLGAIDAAFGHTLAWERIAFVLLSAIAGLIAGSVLFWAIRTVVPSLSWKRAFMTITGWIAGFALASVLAPIWGDISYPLGWLFAGLVGGALSGLITGLVLGPARRSQGQAVIRTMTSSALGLGAAFLIAELVIHPLSHTFPEPFFWPLSRGIGNGLAGMVVGWFLLGERLAKQRLSIYWRIVLLVAAGFFLTALPLNLLFQPAGLYEDVSLIYLGLLGLISTAVLVIVYNNPQRLIPIGLLGSAGLILGHLLAIATTQYDHELVAATFWGFGLGLGLGISTRRLLLVIMLPLLCVSIFTFCFNFLLAFIPAELLSPVIFALVWGVIGGMLAFLYETFAKHSLTLD